MAKAKSGYDPKAEEAADVASFTGWKLDLMRAVNADHKTTPGGHAVFCALVDYANSETCLAWPSIGSLCIKSGMSTKTVRKYLAELVTAQHIEAQGSRPNGAVVYFVAGRRKNAILDDLAMRIEDFRERERERQARNRERRRRTANVTGPVSLPTDALSREPFPGLSRDPSPYEHLNTTPEDLSSAREGSSYNGYALAKGRA